MGGTGLHVTHPVALTAKNTKDHHDETGGPKAGCRRPREVPGGVFLSVFAEICTGLA